VQVLLPCPEACMGRTARADPLAGTVGMEPEGVLAGEVAAVDGEVPGVGP
jgi:hypothetical protein